MSTLKHTSLAAGAAMALLLSVPCAFAQDGPPPPPPGAEGGAPGGYGGPAAGNPGGPGGAQSGDRFAQFRQRMAERMKATLKVNDEEWSAIQPLIEKVMAKQREATGGGRFGGGPGRGGPGGGGGDQGRPQGNHPQDLPAADALRTALESEGTPAADIKAKLEALREARKKATAELEQAREDLRKVLTQRQEATLVLMGILQ